VLAPAARREPEEAVEPERPVPELVPTG
jgi:hypothetical protein